jgi:hypothetical protein
MSAITIKVNNREDRPACTYALEPARTPVVNLLEAFCRRQGRGERPALFKLVHSGAVISTLDGAGNDLLFAQAVPTLKDGDEIDVLNRFALVSDGGRAPFAYECDAGTPLVELHAAFCRHRRVEPADVRFFDSPERCTGGEWQLLALLRPGPPSTSATPRPLAGTVGDAVSFCSISSTVQARIIKPDAEVFDACAAGNAERVRARLAEPGAPSPDCVEAELHKSALMVASELGNSGCVSALLDASADVGKTCVRGLMALMRACSVGSVECVRLLLDTRAMPDQPQASLVSPPFCAGPYSELTRERQELDATALMLAAMGGHVQCVKLLLEAGAAVDAGKPGVSQHAGGIDGGKTALVLALQSGQMECARALIEAGADVNHPDIFDRNAAIDLETVQLMSAYGGAKRVQIWALMAPDLSHVPSTMISMFNGPFGLMVYGASLSSEVKAWLHATQNWTTPLHYVGVVKASRVRQLLAARADPLAKAAGAHAPTPFSLATDLLRNEPQHEGAIFVVDFANRILRCSNPSCLRDHAPPLFARRRLCAKCRSAAYCSVACQKAHWQSGHKETCKPHTDHVE